MLHRFLVQHRGGTAGYRPLTCSHAANSHLYFDMRLLSLLFALLVAGEVYAATIEGRVVKVQDGDTITVLDTDRT